MQRDAIQRSQKLCEARLHDLHQQCKLNEVARADDVKHFRMILGEMQKPACRPVREIHDNTAAYECGWREERDAEGAGQCRHVDGVDAGRHSLDSDSADSSL